MQRGKRILENVSVDNSDSSWIRREGKEESGMKRESKRTIVDQGLTNKIPY